MPWQADCWTSVSRRWMTLIEWAERLGGPVGGVDLEVQFRGAGDDVRQLTLVARSPRGERYVAVAGALVPAARGAA